KHVSPVLLDEHAIGGLSERGAELPEKRGLLRSSLRIAMAEHTSHREERVRTEGRHLRSIDRMHEAPVAALVRRAERVPDLVEENGGSASRSIPTRPGPRARSRNSALSRIW